MLVITRKKGESILIGENVEITIVKVDDGSVKLSINAPRNITILRKELVSQITQENKAAVSKDISVLRKLK